MNLRLVFVLILSTTVLNSSRSEAAANVGLSENKRSVKNIGRLRYRDGEILISQDEEKPTEFFFTPFPSFQSTEAECHENIFTGRLEVGLRIALYTSDVVESAQEYLYKHDSTLCGNPSSSFRCGISLLSMNSIRVVQRTAHFHVNQSKYTLDETWQPAGFLWASMNFPLYPSNRTVCEQIRSTLIARCTSSDFELQYTIRDEQRISKELEVTTEHITNTVLYRRIRAQLSSSETILLTDEDFKELIQQAIQRMTLQLRLEQNFVALEDLQSLEKHLEEAISTEQIRLEANDHKLWNNLYWNSHPTRPDQLAAVLNSILQKDHTDQEKFIYYHQKALNQPLLSLTPHDIYPTELIEADFDEENAFVQSLRSSRVLSRQPKQPLQSNSSTSAAVKDTKKNNRQNIMMMRSDQPSNTNEASLLTHPMVVDYLRRLSDQIYLDDDDDTIKPHAINARLIRFDKFEINQKLFSTTVLAVLQPHFYRLPVRCPTNEKNNETKSTSWITERLQRLESLVNNLTDRTCTIPKEPSKEKQSIEVINQLKTNLLENNRKIEEFKTRLDKLEGKKTACFIKAGKRFGGLGGGDFDDSEALSLNGSYYLSGVRCLQNLNNIQACEFLYTSFHNSQIHKYSNVHGHNGDNIKSAQLFRLEKGERIARIAVKTGEEGVYLGDDRTHVHRINTIQGLKLLTTQGRIIPPDSQLSGVVEEEHHPGYVLGYATGKAGLRIDQLRFYWIRED